MASTITINWIKLSVLFYQIFNSIMIIGPEYKFISVNMGIFGKNSDGGTFEAWEENLKQTG